MTRCRRRCALCERELEYRSSRQILTTRPVPSLFSDPRPPPPKEPQAGTQQLRAVPPRRPSSTAANTNSSLALLS
eukprot:scaffold901_cov167-Amphora_coffeaeformis.AAC.3